MNKNYSIKEVFYITGVLLMYAVLKHIYMNEEDSTESYKIKLFRKYKLI